MMKEHPLMVTTFIQRLSYTNNVPLHCIWDREQEKYKDKEKFLTITGIGKWNLLHGDIAESLSIVQEKAGQPPLTDALSWILAKIII